jgi:hypothetical protein
VSMSTSALRVSNFNWMFNLSTREYLRTIGAGKPLPGGHVIKFESSSGLWIICTA